MLKLKAYAKINLGLRILHPREDGYHELQTVFHRIDLFDELTFEPADALSLHCTPAALPQDERNLCYRAAMLLREDLGRDHGAGIGLRKNIPVGAGLGGGSSDAAATLLGLLRLWKAEISSDRLRSVALRLGSDVPFFLGRGSALATGRGEKLDYFHLPVPYWIVVAYPNLEIPTAWAYARLRLLRGETGTDPANQESISLKVIVQRDMRNPERLRELIHNDFEPLVLGTHHPVLRVRRIFDDAGAKFAQLSGSGSAVFGFFADEREAHAAAALLETDCFVSITPPEFEPEPQTGMDA